MPGLDEPLKLLLMTYVAIEFLQFEATIFLTKFKEFIIRHMLFAQD